MYLTQIKFIIMLILQILSNFPQDFEAYEYRFYLNLTTSYDRKWVVLEPEMGGARQKLLM